MNLSTKVFKSMGASAPEITMFYRAGTQEEKSSDENAMEEVIVKKSYARVRSHFNVELGERWLDLGANIGAFAVFCRLRGATAVCYEPDRENFEILKLNAPDFELHQMAVTASTEKSLVFKVSPNPLNHYRGTVCEAPRRYEDGGVVMNRNGAFLRAQVFDGVKMDIEGSEADLIDNWMLPRTKKLVLEYHTSRDASVPNLANRLAILRKHFVHVKYPAEFDKVIKNMKKVTTYRPRFDQLIFAWGRL